MYLKKLTRTFLLRSKHQLSSKASILARSASITGEAAGGVPAGDSAGECDDNDSCSASGVLVTRATDAALVSKNNNKFNKFCLKS